MRTLLTNPFREEIGANVEYAGQRGLSAGSTPPALIK